MLDDIHSILLTQEQLAEKVRAMGSAISKDFAGKNPLFVGILKGCFVFMADLFRAVDIPCQCEFMAVSSYGGGSVSSGSIEIKYDLKADITDRHVIIVEDILDSGQTLYSLLELLEKRSPASLTIAALLDKPSRRKAPVKAKYTGFEIPDSFVVGFGLDYNEKYRYLPYVGILKESVYS